MTRYELRLLGQVWRWRLALVVTLFCAENSQLIAQQAILVTNADDSGTGTLRWAIEVANNTPGRDVIRLAPSITGPVRILLDSPLPAITDSVVIDGRLPGDGRPGLWIDGMRLQPPCSGLVVTAPDCELVGLAITGFAQCGDNGGSAIVIDNPFGTVVHGCWVGMSPEGAVLGNGVGIHILSGVRHQIGGVLPEERNIICGFAIAGVWIDGGATERNLIAGNQIGLVSTSRQLPSSLGVGVWIHASHKNQIGKTEAPNSVTGCNIAGILISGGASDNVIEGNYIGLQPEGAVPAGNHGHGIFLRGAGAGNHIGVVSKPNIIGFNGGDGIRIGEPGAPTHKTVIVGNWIGLLPEGLAAPNQGNGITIFGSYNMIGLPDQQQAANRIGPNWGNGIQIVSGVGNQVGINSISSNHGLGIKLGSDQIHSPVMNDPKDLDDGPNMLLNYPVLLAADVSSNGLYLQGYLQSAPESLYQVHVYATTKPDPTGYGEGERWLGSFDVLTDPAGVATFEKIIPIGGLTDVDWLCPLAISATGDTSEFGQAVPVKFDPSLADDWKIKLAIDSSAVRVGELVNVMVKVDFVPVDISSTQRASTKVRLHVPVGWKVVGAAGEIELDSLDWEAAVSPTATDWRTNVTLRAFGRGVATLLATVEDSGPYRANNSAVAKVEVLGEEAPELSVLETRISEGNEPIRWIGVPVLLSRPLGADLRFEYLLEPGSASAGEDYLPGGAVGVIPAGQTQSWVYVGIIGDEEPEEDEWFWLILTNSSGVFLKDQATKVWILDDDTPPPLMVDLAIDIDRDVVSVDKGQIFTNRVLIHNDSQEASPFAVLSCEFSGATRCLSISLPPEQTMPGESNWFGWFGPIEPGAKLAVEIVCQALEIGAWTNSYLVKPVESPALLTNLGAVDPKLIRRVIDTNWANNQVIQKVVVGAVSPLQVAGPIIFNPQTGLYEQAVRYRNMRAEPVPAVRIFIGGLRKGVLVYNAIGEIDGTPFVQINRQVGPGEEVIVLVEFYDPLRWGDISPVYSASVTEQISVAPGDGQLVALSPGRAPLILSGSLNKGRFLIEFAAEPGGQYLIEYRDHLDEPWQVALPSVRASGNVVQWIDAGPPKTACPPWEVGSRYYRVLRVK